MQDMQDMMRRLNQSGKRLSKGHRKIAEYIVEHYDKAVFMTASKLGEKVGVSESTVVRFASAMGYEGYPQLQRALQELVRHWLTAVQRFEMATDIDQSEVLRTVLARDWNELAILGAVIALRGALTMLLHWEIKNEKREHEHVLAK